LPLSYCMGSGKKNNYRKNKKSSHLS